MRISNKAKEKKRSLRDSYKHMKKDPFFRYQVLMTNKALLELKKGTSKDEVVKLIVKAHEEVAKELQDQLGNVEVDGVLFSNIKITEDEALLIVNHALELKNEMEGKHVN